MEKKHALTSYKGSKQKPHNKTRATKYLDEFNKMFIQFLTFLI